MNMTREVLAEKVEAGVCNSCGEVRKGRVTFLGMKTSGNKVEYLFECKCGEMASYKKIKVGVPATNEYWPM